MKKAYPRSIRSMMLVVASVLVYVGCSDTTTSDSRNKVGSPVAPAEKERKTTGSLRAVELPIAYSAITHIALVNGYIEDEGIDYRVISVPAGPDIISGLRGGGDKAADLGSIAVTPIITMIGAGAHPVVLATGISSDRRVQLVTFTGSGIGEDPKTLKGKKVGYVGSTVGEIYLSRLLNKAGMNEKDIVAVNGRPADVKNLLLRGDIDAAILWDPFVSQAVRQGNELFSKEDKKSRGKPAVYVDPSLYNMTFNVVALKSKLETQRSAIVMFIRACVKAGDFVKANPEKARRMLEDWLKLEDGDLRHFIETTSFHVSLDVEQMKKDMLAELEWLKGRRSDTKIPSDLSPYIDTSLLSEIDKSRVIK